MPGSTYDRPENSEPGDILRERTRGGFRRRVSLGGYRWVTYPVKADELVNFARYNGWSFSERILVDREGPSVIVNVWRSWWDSSHVRVMWIVVRARWDVDKIKGTFRIAQTMRKTSETRRWEDVTLQSVRHTIVENGEPTNATYPNHEETEGVTTDRTS